MKMFFLLLSLVLSYPAMPALALTADESAPVLYSRGQLSIQRRTPPPPMPWQAPDAEVGNPPLYFDIEIRDGMTMYHQKDWFSLSSPPDGKGVMLAFAAPGLAPVIRLEQYSPLDVLLIAPTGIIAEIIPNIVLAHLPQDLTPQAPVLALLFLKGGTCDRLGIRPGDHATHAMFMPPTTVLSAPSQPAPVPVITETPKAALPAAAPVPAMNNEPKQ